MKVHFIAIGGSAMHNLAISLYNKGYDVSGSDDSIFEPSFSRLKNLGILPKELGWFPEKITYDLDAVILGMHAKIDNPELLKAQYLGLKIYSYPEFIYEQSKDKTRVVIAGSHGKTTITSMVLHVLKYHDIEVDFMVGAQLEGFDTMVNLTKENEFILLEGDEYLSSPIDMRSKFLLYKPNIALISGISWDHINVFPTFDNYKKQFSDFILSISNGGVLIYNGEDQILYDMVENSQNYIKKFAYGSPSFYIKNEKVFIQTEEGDVPLKIFGKHNILNMEGARYICKQFGVHDENFYEAITSFKGASRRLEQIYKKPNYIVYKDFAHSPSKVKATVDAVKQNYNNRKLFACFELHTYSSLTREFLKEYKGSLEKADQAIVFYSKDALQIKGIDPIESDYILECFSKEGLKVFSKPEELFNYLKNYDKENSVFLMMSSGNYGGINFENIFD